MSELRAQVRDAVHCHFDSGTAPGLIRLHFVRDEVIAACASPAFQVVTTPTATQHRALQLLQQITV